ncbi:MAG: YggT family protein [Holophagaceae bacterium]|uniref:YggT family protein n=1 Tax=Candidatus Geothrix skivensis TaxID=2954439 RepID=A0A9D7SGJ6_9BACT|nr:YggT family protein [Candidatus Geothrix skivensis]
MDLVFTLAYHALTVLSWLLIASALISWFPIDPGNRWVKLLHAITDPVLHPIRAIVPPIGGISLDIFIALLLLWGVQRVLAQAVVS